ncbi:hypothetical protein EJ06DRAFT_120087 [Trichodelitschia bisporula]|uniref:Uncharacterized protein n=1 Tax=Trichodelitschia bisporula TaxID=703511 RepID=A0A6G1HPP5_9PEZI|nr:hypothetical protein EJ06DRAFT_120087 [Trichodelitschia bisporula]
MGGVARSSSWCWRTNGLRRKAIKGRGFGVVASLIAYCEGLAFFSCALCVPVRQTCCSIGI